MKKSVIQCILASGLSLCLINLNACAWHARSAQDYPVALHRITLIPDAGNARLIAALQNQFEALGFRVLSKPEPGASRLRITEMRMINPAPPLGSSNLPVSIAFTLKVCYRLTTPRDTPSDRCLSASNTQLITSSESAYLQNNPQAQEGLTQRIVDQIMGNLALPPRPAKAKHLQRKAHHAR